MCIIMNFNVLWWWEGRLDIAVVSVLMIRPLHVDTERDSRQNEAVPLCVCGQRGEPPPWKTEGENRVQKKCM